MKSKILEAEPGMTVTVVSSSIVLVDYSKALDPFFIEYIGEVKEQHFYSDQKKKIKNKKINQFMFIHQDFNTAFNYKQVKQLEEEIRILEEEKISREDSLNIIKDKNALEIIKKGIKVVLDNKNENLYLKFQYV